MATLENSGSRASTGQSGMREAQVRADTAPVSAFDKARTRLQLALDPAIVRRACGYAVVVGAVLIAINHGDAILAGHIDGRRLAKMGLTVVVPYVVSTLSSVGAIRALRR